MPADRWSGELVRERLGLVIGPDEASEPLTALVGLALRRNPKRAYLPVSLVLGKHVPVEPERVRAAAQALARRVGQCFDADGELTWGDCVVLGYAENATALAHLVADALDADYVVHTTRRSAPGAAVLAAFDEEHSHAPSHLLVPDDPGRWTPDRRLVLVDDELTTGRTVAVTLRLLHRRLPRPRYLVATLADLRGHDDDAIERAARELGVRVDVVALTRAALSAPEDVLRRAAGELAAGPDVIARPEVDALSTTAPITVSLPVGDAPEGARFGLDRSQRAALEGAVPGAAAALAEVLPPRPGRVLLLGSEELHYLPIRLAENLAALGMAVDVGATTRSPLVARDIPGYPVRSALAFAAHDQAHDEAPGAGSERYAYGLGAPAAGLYDTVVTVVDAAARPAALRRTDGLLSRLQAVAGRVVAAVVSYREPRPALTARGHASRVPARRGPEFGTFASEEVGWLVSDLSGVALETSRSVREESIGSGHLHYSETLPREQESSSEYAELMTRVLDRAAPAAAAAVGRLADRVLARHGPDTVLVSLARAGTPVGVLVRRWASRVRGIVVPHYTMSALRGRGLDQAALNMLTAAYDPATLVFLDGWTGSGGILDQVRNDVLRYAHETGVQLDPTVAVLADPARCTALAGTQEDLLVPHACLNATVSGLISRTVSRADLLAPGAYDGAKFYAELTGADRTATFLDAISSRFPTAGTAPLPDRLLALDVDERGPRYLAGLADQLAIGAGERLRAGIGETLRALLRRDPASVHVLPDTEADLEPLHRLCHERAVPVRALPTSIAGIPSPYRCVGVLRHQSGG